MLSSVSSRRSDVVSILLVDASEDDRVYCAASGRLSHCAAGAATRNRLSHSLATRRRALSRRVACAAASGRDVDAWPVRPAGLFGDILHAQRDTRVTPSNGDVYRRRAVA